VPVGRADGAAVLQPLVAYWELVGRRSTGQPGLAVLAATGHRTLVGGGSCEAAEELAVAWEMGSDALDSGKNVDGNVC
jgi:hypothetical protein